MDLGRNIGVKSCPHHLAVVLDRKTQLWHGALYRHHPTPSGCDRWLLASTTTLGFGSEREAAMEVNKLAARGVIPGLKPLDIDKFPNENSSVRGLRIRRGCVVSRVEEKTSGVCTYELRRPGESCAGPASQELTEAQFRVLHGRGRIRQDSCSGDDPGLHYHYTHYKTLY